MANIDRFLTAQNRGRSFLNAKLEIDNGRKKSHWIWYIFPQIDGMGRSGMAEKYAIANLSEACEYLSNSSLLRRYQDILISVNDKLTDHVDVVQLMGSHIDALKLTSSLTLFEAAAQYLSQTKPQQNEFQQFAILCSNTLNLLTNQGFPKCEYTLSKLPQ